MPCLPREHYPDVWRTHTPVSMQHGPQTAPGVRQPWRRQVFRQNLVALKASRLIVSKGGATVLDWLPGKGESMQILSVNHGRVPPICNQMCRLLLVLMMACNAAFRLQCVDSVTQF